MYTYMGPENNQQKQTLQNFYVNELQIAEA
jgi:hypothetical protein